MTCFVPYSLIQDPFKVGQHPRHLLQEVKLLLVDWKLGLKWRQRWFWSHYLKLVSFDVTCSGVNLAAIFASLATQGLGMALCHIIGMGGIQSDFFIRFVCQSFFNRKSK